MDKYLYGSFKHQIQIVLCPNTHLERAQHHAYQHILKLLPGLIPFSSVWQCLTTIFENLYTQRFIFSGEKHVFNYIPFAAAIAIV